MFTNKNTKKVIFKERTLLIIMSMFYSNTRKSICLILMRKKNKEKVKNSTVGQQIDILALCKL